MESFYTFRFLPYNEETTKIMRVSNNNASWWMVMMVSMPSCGVVHGFSIDAPPPATPVLVEQPALPRVMTTEYHPTSQYQQLPLLSSSLSVSAAATAAAPATAPTGKETATITYINYDGKVPTTESDEYVVLSNGSKTSPLDVSGYTLYVATSGTQGATFVFPSTTSLIKPGGSVRVYTNEIHKESGGYSFGSGKALWNNRGGLAVLKDAKGNKICEYKYKPDSSA